MLNQKIQEVIERLIPDEEYARKHPQGLLISKMSGYDPKLSPASCSRIIRDVLKRTNTPYATYDHNKVVLITPETPMRIPAGSFFVLDDKQIYTCWEEKSSILTRIEELTSETLSQEEKIQLLRKHGSALWFYEPTKENNLGRTEFVKSIYGLLRSEGWAAIPIRDKLKR